MLGRRLLIAGCVALAAACAPLPEKTEPVVVKPTPQPHFDPLADLAAISPPERDTIRAH